MSRRHLHPATLVAVLVYAATGLVMVLEQWGRITNDNRLELSVDPQSFWWANFTLWHPEASLGEVHNQQYGYMFPQGIFFMALDWLGLPAWVIERLWSVALVVVAAEGCRRLARAVGLAPWPAMVAGLAFAFNVRILTEVGVRSAEILPTVVLPLVALPVVHALNGRLRPRTAAILSAAAFACGGAANATATIAGLPLVLVLLVWGLRTRRCGWSLPIWWAGAVATASLWWVVGLLTLGRYSAPFFDYVEDARTSTSFAGASASLRGASNWVNVITVGDTAWWPAGLALTTTPWLVVVTGTIAVTGLAGLVALRSAYRTPLAWAAFVGFACLTVGIAAAAGSPIAGPVRTLLDGPLVPLRNIHKVDGVLRVPLSIGFGAAVAALAAAWSRRTTSRRRAGTHPDRMPLVALLATAVVLTGATPVWAGDLRTPGFTRIPVYWQAASDYLDDHPEGGRTWVIPGAGFGLQSWGWSIEEPLGVLGDTPWLSRSQVPLVPSGTIRMLSGLESLIETGAGSPRLGAVLARMGIGHVLVRHDLDQAVAESTSSALVSTAMARSGGVRRVRAFGESTLGVQVEIFEVTAPLAPALRVRALDDAVTVASSAGDVVAGRGSGLLPEEAVALVQGDEGWSAPAQLVGDAYRRRERTFGRVHDAHSSMMTASQDFRLERLVTDYPGPEGARPAFVEYDGIAGVTASSSLGYADNFGPIRPENGPFSAIDGDPSTSWRSGSFLDPRDQWLSISFETPRRLDEVTVTTPFIDFSLNNITAVELVAGARTVHATMDGHGVATARLGGVEASELLIRTVAVDRPGADQPVGISEVTIPGLHPTRTVVLPEVVSAPSVDLLFTATPETRSCQQTLFGPDCLLGRHRPGEEAAGIDRTFTLGHAGEFTLAAEVVARSDASSMSLLQPLYGVQARGSSVFTNDPAVSYRMAVDGLEATSWIADLGDPTPTLTLTWPRRATIDRLEVVAPPGPAAVPTRALLTSGRERRVVDLRGFGTFAPLRAREVSIEFSRPGQPGVALGMSEVRLSPSSAVNPLDGNNPTGAYCGFGPLILVDGVRHETRVEGLMGDVMSAGTLRVVPCRPGAGQEGREVAVGTVRLQAGQHRVQMVRTSQFQPVTLALSQPMPDRESRQRTWRVTSRTDDRVTGTVGHGPASILSTNWNANPGWTAMVGGTPLAAQTVDGWAQGWILPEGLRGDVVIEFAPQRQYAVGLAVGLGLLALLLLLALVLLGRTRLVPTVPGPTVREQDVGPKARLAGRLGLVGLGALAGGPPLAAGVAGGLLLGRRPRLARAAVVLLAVTAVVAAGSSLTGSEVVVNRWVDAVTSLLVGGVLAPLLTTRPRSS